MPITQKLLLSFSPIWLGVLIVGASVLMSVAGLVIVRRYISHKVLKGHNDIAGAIFNTLGVAYAVLLAFVAVVAWQNFDRSSQNVESEANCLINIARDSSAFGKEFHEQAMTLAMEYSNSVVKDEWPLLASGEGSSRTREAFEKLFSLYTVYMPQNKREEIFLSESIKNLNMLGELRRTRIFDSKQGIHPILWMILLAGAAVTVVFTFFFGSDNHQAQILMTSLLATLIALIIYTILMLDFPFTGSVSIEPTAFRQMYKY